MMAIGKSGALNGYPIRSIEKPIPLTELANCLAELLELTLVDAK